MSLFVGWNYYKIISFVLTPFVDNLTSTGQLYQLRLSHNTCNKWVTHFFTITNEICCVYFSVMEFSVILNSSYLYWSGQNKHEKVVERESRYKHDLETMATGMHFLCSTSVGVILVILWGRGKHKVHHDCHRW